MIEKIIRNRRTVKPANMNGKIISDVEIETMLEMADWAPTHGRTEPWRFIVFSHAKAVEFCNQHAMLYKTHTEGDRFNESTYEKLMHQADFSSHLIVVYLHTGTNPKIPLWEEIAAGACAVQNMLLFAESKGISTFWSTGGMTTHPALQIFFGLSASDQIIGLLFAGYADTLTNQGMRKISLAEKIRMK